MAFIKKDWKCGDTITADDLNRLENGVEEALDGGSVDCGYSCSEERVTLTDESVTTTIEEGNSFAMGNLAYSELITADTIKVIFNGTEYTCSKQVVSSDSVEYGAPFDEETEQPNWSEYPFAISSSPMGNLFVTETASTYQVKIETYEKTVETSECFDRARGYSCFESSETLLDGTVVTSYEPKSGITSGNLNFHVGEFPQITVIFDGVEYKCPLVDYHYGSSSSRNFSEYPFQIVPDGIIYTATEGTHSITIMHIDESIETTECFKKAVKSVGVGGGVMMLNYIDSNIEGATWQEAYDALQNGTMVYLKRDGDILPCGYFDNSIIGFDTTIISAVSPEINTISIVWSVSGSISDQSRTYPSA